MGANLKEFKKKVDNKKKGKDQVQLLTRSSHEFYLKKNIEAIKASGDTQLLELIKILKDVPIKNVDIDPNVVINGVKNPLCCMYVGFSSKVLYEAIKRKKKLVKYVCIIEPDLGVFKNLLETEDISDLLLDKNVDFVLGITGKELIPTLFRNFTQQMEAGLTRTAIIQSMESIVDPFQYTTDDMKEKAAEINALIQESTRQLQLSMGCSDDQFRRFELFMENKESMFKAWNIGGLYDKFSEVPAIICGGGPSLDTFISEYKANPDQFKNSIIIAVDAVLYKLLSNGIRPHIVTRCERKYTEIFKGITKDMTKGVYYSAYPWTPPEFFNLFDDYFYLFRQNGVCLSSDVKHSFVDGGVSSGNAALEIAINLGCKNIMFTGIDLGFIDGKSHTEDTQVEFNVENSKDKWLDIPSNDGGKITSIPVWIRCLNEYIQAIDKHHVKGRKFEVYNTSEKGAVIALTKYAKWTDLKDVMKNDNDITKMIELYRSKLPNNIQSKFEEKIQGYLSELKMLKQTVTVANSLASDARRTAEGEIYKLLERIKLEAEKPYDVIRQLRINQPNLEKLWKGCADAYDQNFRNKCYSNQTFRILIFDVLQLDLFQYENGINSMYNLREFMDERYYDYFKLTRDFTCRVGYYLDKFIELYEKK